MLKQEGENVEEQREKIDMTVTILGGLPLKDKGGLTEKNHLPHYRLSEIVLQYIRDIFSFTFYIIGDFRTHSNI